MSKPKSRRAEDVAKQITVYCENNYPVGPTNWYSEIEPMIAKALNEYAVAEVRIKEHEGKPWKYIDEIYQQGRNSALEEAAKVVEDVIWEGINLAERIRALKKETL